MCAVKRVIREVSMSEAESMPSATVARLPATSPAEIFNIDKAAFTKTAILDATTIFFSRLPVKLLSFYAKVIKLLQEKIIKKAGT